ncbi:phytanoyl-CoA dioxygenase family protein [Winogradskyella sp.]|uniref:phytanoyl-CoA dioxygenase family protein n=1 Tax=Winogradskyella sp. TaxID=1883156 RepID=UPI0035189D0C
MDFNDKLIELNTFGYSSIKNFFSESEVESLLNCIEIYKHKAAEATKNNDLFVIRGLINTIPELKHIIFNNDFINLLGNFFESNYFLTKGIYFDKLPKSNWFVAYHQDLSISVNKKVEVNGFKNWTNKKGIYGVQPPECILNNSITIRVHLDDTTQKNGALRVIPKSHTKGIITKNSANWNLDNEYICEAKKGSIMLMKPLLLHASSKTINDKRRRVIHLEFNSNALPKPLEWAEFQLVK